MTSVEGGKVSQGQKVMLKIKFHDVTLHHDVIMQHVHHTFQIV